MTFVHPLLLGGLLLIGIPVLIHLIMQQKPKRLAFPAFRFLLQKYRTNRRSIRLRHLLLLLLRIALIALICLALARPKLFSERLNLGSDRPFAVVFLFDTSYSMEYGVAGKTRLEEAQKRALELLADLPTGSTVAVLDSAELGGEWLPSTVQAAERIRNLKLRYANAPVNRQLAQAQRLLDTLAADSDPDAGPPPRFLYVFSDRTLECWDDTATKGEDRAASGEKEETNPTAVLFIDVGVEDAVDVAIANVELPQPVVPPNGRLEIRVTVRAAGAPCDTFATCRLDDEPTGERKPVQLRAGESQVLAFDRTLTQLKPGPHRLEVKLGSNDALPFDNARFATFLVRGGRKVLTLADDPQDAHIWKLALQSTKSFQCEVLPTNQAATLDVAKLLADYRVVCLVNVNRPGRELWALLEEYVRKGGSLAIVPGSDLDPASYHDDRAAARLVPARFRQVVTAANPEPGDRWAAAGAHPMLAPFQDWRRSAEVDFQKPELEPKAGRYWLVAEDKDAKDVHPIVRYDNADKPPAVLERTVGEGRVLQFTTGFDGKRVNNQAYWNNYLESSFYLVLVNKAVGYLAGDEERPALNFQSGQTATVALPPTPRFPVYRLSGPGLSGAETTVSRLENQGQLQITQATTPGNFTVIDGQNQVTAGFSVNVRPEECLLDRVPVEKIEAVLGPGTVLPLKQQVSLSDALQQHWKQPVELLPFLLLLLLLVLALENLLANRFYRPAPGGGEEATA